MATFLTEFPIDKTKSIDDFISLCARWIAGIQRSEITADKLTPTDEAQNEWHYESDTEGMTAIKVVTDEMSVGGVRHWYIDDDRRRWSSEVVCTKLRGSSWISVRVDSTSEAAAPKIPVPKRPYILKMLMEEDWPAIDGVFQTQDAPHYLDMGDAEFAAQAIHNGDGHNHLPIVYVSIQDDGTYSIDSEKLAIWLSGRAHVVVEPSRSFSFDFARQANHSNPYNGTIGVYWPAGGGMWRYFMDPTHKTAFDIETAIARDTVTSLANRRPHPECNWRFLREQVSRQRIRSLKEGESASVEEWVSAFEDELNEKQAALEEANAEVHRLEQALQAARAEASAMHLVEQGHEFDLYPQEIKYTIVSALKGMLPSVGEGTRKQHILRDLIDRNHVEDVTAPINGKIKNILKGYTSISKKMKADLIDLGFDLSHEGKHHKLVFRGDPRYTFILASTPSDNRSGMNAASDICKKLF